jgi:hypothetical protein
MQVAAAAQRNKEAQAVPAEMAAGVMVATQLTHIPQQQEQQIGVAEAALADGEELQ